DAVFRFWNGISAPAKTPRDIVNKLHDAAETALKDPALREKLAKLGVEPAQMSVEEFSIFFRDDLNATVELAKKADIKPLD
ncbi:MAG: tripartite tricarboxylate transporter substrate-binding protein, partial [Pseudolabrys sp.]